MIRSSPSIVPSITGRAVAVAFFAGLLAVLFAPLTDAGERSLMARADFLKGHPCPVSGKRSSACPGYVVGHITPITCGGVDHADNMQWQSQADAAATDKIARRGCEKSVGLPHL